MPIRTVNLKLVLGKKSETAELRQALWFTHSIVNEAVARIEQLLLLCRGDAYWTVDIEGKEKLIPEHEVNATALKLARTVQQKNGVPFAGRDKEILNALRSLYERIVPSCLLDDKGNPQNGDAQTSNAWVSPLMDPDSKGGLSVYEKVLDPPPFWFEQKATDSVGWEQASVTWLESDDGQRLQNYPGSPPAWVRKLRKGQPWQEDFITDQAKKKKEIEEGSAPIVKELKELGLLPICDPMVRKALDPEGSGVSVWDRLAVRLAVTHLLSWESWNHRTRTEHEAAKAKLDELKKEYAGFTESFGQLRRYESERHRQLKQVSLADDSNPYRIGLRTMRGWERVRQQWLQSGNTAEERKAIAKRLQTRLGGKFGDPDLFLWLAEAGREMLWRGDDVLTPLVKLNIAAKFVDKRKEYALMTFADARQHPRWVMYEATGGTNLKNYSVTASGAITVGLPLLSQTEDGSCVEKSYSLKVGSSGQLDQLQLAYDRGTGVQALYSCSYQQYSGVLGGAELLFDRPYLENAGRNEALLSENPGPVWLKISIDVASKAPEAWLDGKGRTATPAAVHHFKTALANKSKHVDMLTPGLSVLSVDLGMRSFASCSVFELVQGRPEKGLAFPAADGRGESTPDKLWAKHVRSFKLTLPGETPTPREESERVKANDELRSIRRDVNRLKDILRLGAVADDIRRDELIASFLVSLAEDSGKEVAFGSALETGMFIGFGDARFRSDPALWEEHCKAFYDKAEQAVSVRFSQWRMRTRKRSSSWADWRERRSYHGGKSVWMLEYLDAVRKLIMGWNLRGRSYGQVNRADRKQYGTIASRLLHHINQLKDDRIKSGADLIIQAARGYVQVNGGNGWLQKHEPCRLILFEDLSRYRFRVDRPRRENSLLMKWNHREIINAVTMQGELYGLIVDTTSAGFSSRFLASTGGPGVRCRYLGAEDFDGGLPKPYVVRELDWLAGNSSGRDFADLQQQIGEKIKPGMWVPWNGGEMFASISEKGGKAHFIHSDINAAQNLQRRFWSRAGEAYRIVCKKIELDGQEGWMLEKPPGARLSGALKQLEYGDKPFVLMNPKAKENSAAYVMRPAGKAIKPTMGQDDEALDDGLEDMLVDISAESSGGRETFFRDPSGFFFNPENWIPSKIYWPQVKRMIWRQLSLDELQTKADEGDGLPF